jgi:formylglycine-generating enzyme required for sulfatase activity
VRTLLILLTACLCNGLFAKVVYAIEAKSTLSQDSNHEPEQGIANAVKASSIGERGQLKQRRSNISFSAKNPPKSWLEFRNVEMNSTELSYDLVFKYGENYSIEVGKMLGFKVREYTNKFQFLFESKINDSTIITSRSGNGGNTTVSFVSDLPDGKTEIVVARVYWSLTDDSVAQRVSDWAPMLTNLGSGNYDLVALGFGQVDEASVSSKSSVWRDVPISSSSVLSYIGETKVSPAFLYSNFGNSILEIRNVILTPAKAIYDLYFISDRNLTMYQNKALAFRVHEKSNDLEFVFENNLPDSIQRTSRYGSGGSSTAFFIDSFDPEQNETKIGKVTWSLTSNSNLGETLSDWDIVLRSLGGYEGASAAIGFGFVDSYNVRDVPLGSGLVKPYLGSSLVNTGTSLSGLNGLNSPALESTTTRTVDLSSSVNLEMIWVEPGTFTMGSPVAEEGRIAELEYEHNVTLTQGFHLGKYEVTQAQYEAVMTGNADGLSATPSYFSGNPNRPVEGVSWDDVQLFLTRFNSQQASNIPSGWAFVLPTEAQWEYACRAGTTTIYSWGNDINPSRANYNNNIGATVDVGQYLPNPWGFFDMHGNVREWTADWYRSNRRFERGGSWGNDRGGLRSARRGYSPPSQRDRWVGFRLALTNGNATKTENDQGSVVDGNQTTTSPGSNGSNSPALESTTTRTVDLSSSVNLEMIWVEPGTFTMGQEGYERVHEVTLTKGFYFGKYELTNAQYEAVTGRSPIDANTTGRGNHPVGVNWHEAENFCIQLTALEREAGRLPSGWMYVLPTEAEWEYACRAGTTTTYYYGDDFDYSMSWSRYSDNGRIPRDSLEVGQYPSNSWGFHDMYGNTHEWTADWYTYYLNGPVVDPVGPSTGTGRVYRGGSSGNSANYSRSSVRIERNPTLTYAGFRVALKDINATGTGNDEGSVVDGNQTTTSPGSNGSNSPALESTTTRTVDLSSSVNLEMIWVEPGTFTMGQEGYEKVHEVTLTKGFYFGKYELTNAQYEAVTGRSPIDANTTGRGNHPVGVNWHEAENFCGQLTALERDAGRLPSGWMYVLPTEAEWEYACRAGTTTTYYYGDDFDYSMSWSRYSDNGKIPRDSLEVGQYPSNSWGFHDMYGNTLEWTADWYTYYLNGPVVDPVGPSTGTERVYRGGGSGNSANYSRSSVRWGRDPTTTYAGLRIVLKEINANGTGNDQSSETSSKFNTERTDDGILLRWENPATMRYHLKLKNGSNELFFGGHPKESTTVNYAQFNLTGTEILTARFAVYDNSGSFKYWLDETKINLSNYSSEKPVDSGSKQYTLSLSSGTGGSVIGGGAIDKDTNAPIQAVPSQEYRFKYWEGSGVKDPYSHQTSALIQADANIKAIFEYVGKWTDGSARGSDPIFGTARWATQNWWYSPWFGYFWHNPYKNWIYHTTLGWLYLYPVDSNSIWAYAYSLNGRPYWLWIHRDHFPFVYSQLSYDRTEPVGHWLYLDFLHQRMQFWRASLGQWSPKAELHGSDSDEEALEPAITPKTYIKIFFDSSGSMNSTLFKLEEMVQGEYQNSNSLRSILQDFYATETKESEGNGDPATNGSDRFRDRVSIVSNKTERTFAMLLNSGSDGQAASLGFGTGVEDAFPDASNVVIIVFQDEANGQAYYNESIFQTASKNATYDSDIEAFRNSFNEVNLLNPSFYRGMIMQVRENGYPTQVGFRDFLDAVVQGKGAYSEDNGLSELPFTDCLKVVNDIRDGYEAESYYRNLIGNALIQLGFKINL